MASRLTTAATELFGVEHPVVQTGMGWVAYPTLVAAVSNAGGLGILASATLSYDEMVTAIDEIKVATDKPYGVNFRTDIDDIDRRIDHCIAQGVKVASFAQAPGREMVEKLKEAGVVTMPTVGAPRHAEKVAEWGVDAVIAQGAEGGGHTGSVPTSILIPGVVGAVDIPVLAAGGITGGTGLAAALAWGAAGVAMGTRFLLCAESEVPAHIKDVYFETGLNGTVVSTAIDGVPQRVIRTSMVDRLESAGLLAFPLALRNALEFRRHTNTSLVALVKEGLAMKKASDMSWSQVALGANAPMLTRASMVDGKADVGILPTGQGLGVIGAAPSAEEIVQSMVTEAVEALGRTRANVAD